MPPALLTDLCVELNEPATVVQVNRVVAEAADGPLKGLRFTEDPTFFSRDFVGDRSSCIFDSWFTQANGPAVKVFGWYGNEWGSPDRAVVRSGLSVAGRPTRPRIRCRFGLHQPPA